MARRERDRYAERDRPHRRASSPGGAEPPEQGSGSLKNPAVVLGLVGLVAAGIMIIGFLYGSSSTGQGTTGADADATATILAALPTDSDIDFDATPSAEDAAGAALGDTGALTGTGALTESLPSGNRGPFPAAEDQGLDAAGKSYFATIATPKGDIVVELWPELAPQHVNSFVFLARQGYFDGLTFHRVEPGFVIQGGDPTGTGSGGPGYEIPGEFNSDNPVPHRIGTLAMARTPDPNSAGSQFYIILADSPNASSLDGQYTVFGHVVSGMGNALSIERGDPMTQVMIEEKPIEERIVSPDDIRAGELPEGLE